MAYYIEDNYDMIATRQGIKLICDYLRKLGEEINIELRYVGTESEVILIQTVIKSLNSNHYNNYSNTVSLHVGKSITVNPIMVNGKNQTKELVSYIESLPSILRDMKLESIL